MNNEIADDNRPLSDDDLKKIILFALKHIDYNFSEQELTSYQDMIINLYHTQKQFYSNCLVHPLILQATELFMACMEHSNNSNNFNMRIFDIIVGIECAFLLLFPVYKTEEMFELPILNNKARLINYIIDCLQHNLPITSDLVLQKLTEIQGIVKAPAKKSYKWPFTKRKSLVVNS